MPKPFDAATKQLVETRPADWLAFLGLPGTSARLVDADVSTITAEADRVVRVENGANPYLLHVEFQASYDADMGRRLLRYNVLLHYRHQVPVQSVVVLLRQKADGPQMTGRHDYQTPNGSLAFVYETVRLWQAEPETILAGGLGTLPLAPLANLSRDDLPRVVQAMEARIIRETSGSEGGLLRMSAYLLMGLSYPAQLIEQLFQGIPGMEESSTFQALLERGRSEGRTEGRSEGRTEEAQNLLLHLGEKRLGPPGAAVRRVIADAGLTELETWIERLFATETWDELFV